MIAAQIVSPKQIVLVDVETPVRALQEALVEVTHIGICGSDLPAYGGDGGVYPKPVGAPVHEVLGTMTEDLEDLRAGQRVLVLSRPGMNRLVSAPRPCLLPLPADLPAPQALVTQPLGTVIHALRKLPCVLGWKAIVVGSGPIGLLFVAMLRHLGCSHITVVDPQPDRLERAQALGADEVRANTAAQARQAGLEEAQLVVEAVGLPETLSVAPLLASRGGIVLMFGVPHQLPPGGLVPCDFDTMLRKDICVIFSHGPDVKADHGLARDLIASGRIDVGPVVSHVLPFAEVARGFSMAFERAPGTAKIVLEMGS